MHSFTFTLTHHIYINSLVAGEFFMYMGQRYTQNAKNSTVQIPHSRTNGWQASWKKFLIDMMYLRGYVTLYPNFGPNQPSFSTNHMELGVHVNSAQNTMQHGVLELDFRELLSDEKLPMPQNLQVINLFNHATTLANLKVARASLFQDDFPCEPNQSSL